MNICGFCLAGTFPNTTTGYCDKCGFGCEKCDSATVCTECNSYYSLNATTHGCDCGTGKFMTEDKKCIVIPDSCVGK